jgi:hypothetical protein
MTLNTWGEASWGDGYYGVEYLDIITDGRNINDAVSEWDIPPTIQEESNNYALLRGLLQSSDKVDESAELIYNAHHINTASGEDLDEIGKFVGVDRESNESDSRYRTRIKARFRAATIEPTTDNFTEFVAAILATGIDNFTILREQFRPEVTISAQGNVWESNDLTAQTLVELLEDGVPAGHAVNVQEQGTFRLKVDGEVDDPDQGLTSDSIETGGTLASDLI